MKKRYLICQRDYDRIRPEFPPELWRRFLPRHIFRQMRYWIGSWLLSGFFLRFYRLVGFPVIGTQGINHCSSAFCAILREAMILERTVVLPRYRLPPKHNFDKPLIYTFDRYYDLSKSYTIYEGRKRPIDHISWSDYVGKGLFHCLNALSMKSGHRVSPKQNRKTLIMRIMKQSNLSDLPYRGREAADQVQVHLELKDELVQSAMRFAEHLGDYDALHFRKLERAWNVPSIYKNFVQDGELARQLPKVFKPGRRLFVMSNMHSPKDERFFSGLHDIYEIRRYTEEPELKKLAFGEFPDTQKLFLIEEQIFKHAKKTLKVHWHNIKELQEILNMPSDQIADC